MIKNNLIIILIFFLYMFSIDINTKNIELADLKSENEKLNIELKQEKQKPIDRIYLNFKNPNKNYWDIYKKFSDFATNFYKMDDKEVMVCEIESKEIYFYFKDKILIKKVLVEEVYYD